MRTKEDILFELAGVKERSDNLERENTEQSEHIAQLEKTIEIIGEHENRRIKKLESDLQCAVKEIGEWGRKVGYLEHEKQHLKELLFKITQRYVFDMMRTDGDCLVPLIEKALIKKD